MHVAIPTQRSNFQLCGCTRKYLATKDKALYIVSDKLKVDSLFTKCLLDQGVYSDNTMSFFMERNRATLSRVLHYGQPSKHELTSDQLIR